MNESGWTGRWAGVAAALLGAASVAGTAGCAESRMHFYTKANGEALDCPEDPAEAEGGAFQAACGIWVSASLGHDDNDGSSEAPVATLDQALSKALSGPRRVYACAETFEEAVNWPAGVSLHGGFYCADLDWRYGGGAEDVRTVVTAAAKQIPLTLTGSAFPEPSTLTDLWVLAEAATTPGGSSIAVLAQAEAHAEIRRSKLESGRGADGADGDEGDHFGAAAKDGLLGHDGAAACTGIVGFGGAMVALACDDDASFGGQGGDGGQLAANAGDDGEVAPVANPQGFGVGGTGENLGASLFCLPGLGGAAGNDGEPGLGGAWPPRLTQAGYAGVWGGTGQRGRPGQGGGGGGASAGTVLCGMAPHGGAGGGSGGSGGCGGKGGKGGQPGGASIGLATLSARLTLIGVGIIAGDAGHGGRGGSPQQGGQGGLPGIGGAGFPAANGPNPACVGGGGGYGGDGGHAGGGLGGSSLAIAYVGVHGPSWDGGQLVPGLAGSGGLGSDANLSSSAGQAGQSSQLEALLP